MKTGYKYGRNIRLVLETDDQVFDLSSFRITFQVVHGSTTTPKVLRCRIYNLSHGGRGTKNTIAAIQESKEKTIALSTWYNGQSPALLFSGLVRQVYAGRESPLNTYLDIGAAVLEKEIATGGVSSFIQAGWTHEDILKQGLAPNNIKAGELPATQGQGVRPKILYGNCRAIIREMARNLQAIPIIDDNGQLNFIKVGNLARPKGEAIHLSPNNGLIGTPIQVPEGIQVTALLDPRFVIGQELDIYSANASDSHTAIQQEDIELNFSGVNRGNLTYNSDGTSNVRGLSHTGRYRILFADHTGDTRGTTWYSTIVGQAVDPSDQSIYTSRGISAQ